MGQAATSLMQVRNNEERAAYYPQKNIMFSFKKYVYFFSKRYNFSYEVGGSYIEWKYACRMNIDDKGLQNLQ